MPTTGQTTARVLYTIPCPGGCGGNPTPYDDSDDACMMCGGRGRWIVVNHDQTNMPSEAA